MADIYELDVDGKKLEMLDKVDLSAAGFKEQQDLESWFAGTSESLFGGGILWIARQDSVSDDQRSDLVAIHESGDLLLFELKRGTANRDALIQALGYAAEYSEQDAEALVELFAGQVDRDIKSPLVDPPKSVSDARDRIAAHVGQADLNQNQVVMLVAEAFDSEVLAVSDYLNDQSGDTATFSIECWEFGLYGPIRDAHVVSIRQVVPAPSVRDSIIERREVARDRKYVWDRTRGQLVTDVQDEITKDSSTRRRPGMRYGFLIQKEAWDDDVEAEFSYRPNESPFIHFPMSAFNAIEWEGLDAVAVHEDAENELLTLELVRTSDSIEFDTPELVSFVRVMIDRPTREEFDN